MVYPSVRVLRAAELKWYRLYVVERALGEARRALRTYGEEAQLEVFLEQCDRLDQCPETTPAVLGLTDEEYQAEIDRMTACLRDPDDAPIALDMRYAAVRPHLFVSSNKAHWKQTAGDAIGGVRIATSKDFAARLHPLGGPTFGY